MRHRNVAPSLLAVAISLFGLGGCSSDGGQDTKGGAGTSAGGAPSSGGSGVGGANGGALGGGAAGEGGSLTGGGAGSGGSAGSFPGAGEFTDRTSTELIASLTLGWNVGNSLDAPEGETAWNNPAISAGLLETVADAGFDIVRIPVTWSLHTGAGPDYVIDEAWLGRVEEVVQLANDAGLYAIINLHHDGADGYDGVEWLTLNDAGGAVTGANNTAVEARFVAVWTQIAARFKNHGEQLIFESMNEIHDGYGAPDPQYFGIINNLNQVFVDTVRGSGGNNAERHLVVPGYNTNIDHTLTGFEPPEDPTPNRLILSVHYYDPWGFAGAATTNVWGQASEGRDDYGQEGFVTSQFDKLKATYGDAGLPVIIGEYGAVQQDGFDDYRRYYMEYVTKAAVDRGILPVYWDNGGEGSGADNFALFSRDTNAVLHAELLDAMMRAATSSYTLEDVAPPAP